MRLWAADWATQRLVLRCFGIRELRSDALECVLSCSDVTATFEDEETRKAMLGSEAALAWLALVISEGEGCCASWNDSLTRAAVLAAASKELTEEAMTIMRAWTKEKPRETFHTSSLRQLVVLAADDEKRRRSRAGALEILQQWRTHLPSEFAAKAKSEFSSLEPALLLENNRGEDCRQPKRKKRRPLEELISGI